MYFIFFPHFTELWVHVCACVYGVYGVYGRGLSVFIFFLSRERKGKGEGGHVCAGFPKPN